MVSYSAFQETQGHFALGRAQKKLLLHEPSKVLVLQFKNIEDLDSVASIEYKRMVNFMMFNGKVIIHITEYGHDLGV